MARIGFHGFKAGTAVELVLHKFGKKIPARSERWGDPAPIDPEAVDPSPESWGALPATAGADVTVWRSDMEVAPEGIYFQVTDFDGFDTPAPAAGETYDRRYHELVYLWDFDDPGSTFSAPVNVLAHQRDANVAYGPQVAHTYTKPGTYNPSVIIFEPSSGKLAKVSLGPYTVQDPDAVFKGDENIYVDDEAIYADAPEGARTFSDLRQALDQARSRDATKCRVILRSGRTFPLADYYFQSSALHHKNVYICGEAGKPEPTINNTSDASLFKVINKFNGPTASEGLDVVFTHLKITGDWDSSREVGISKHGFMFSNSNPERMCKHFLMHDVHLSGFDQAFQLSDAGQMTTIISDCTITNWRDYAIYGGTRRVAFIGTRMAQQVDAFSGGPKNGGFNQHGVMRMNNVDTCVMDGCDFFTNHGWWVNFNPFHTQQPVLRWNFMGHQDPNRMALNMQRCTNEGGLDILAFAHMNNRESIRDQNALIERSTFVGSHMTRSAVFVAFGGLTIRQNVMVFPDPKRIDFYLFNPDAFLLFNNEGLSTGEEIAPIRFEHNTCVCLASPENCSESWKGKADLYRNETLSRFVQLAPDVVRLEGNIVHQPNLATPEIAYAPLDTTPIWQARSLGYKDGGGGTVRFEKAVPDGGTFEIPYPAEEPKLTASAFSDGQHFLKYSAKHGNALTDGSFDIRFGPSSATVTNRLGAEIPAGHFVEWRFDRSQGDNPVEMDTTFATPANSVATYAPLEGSAALGAGSEDSVAILDFYGARRPAYPSFGAFEISG